MEDTIKKHILGLLFGIIISGILTGVGMLVGNSTRSAVFDSQFTNLEKTIDSLTSEVKILRNEVINAGQDHWTRREQSIYATERNYQTQSIREDIQKTLDKLDDRIRVLEKSRSK